MDQQPKIPTLKDAQKPQVKVKGMGAGLTLFDRLKQFKKKDLAFILAGLGTLFMAPLAEHFMMAPESGSELKGGFGGGSGGSGSNLFGSGSSPYESGNNSIAQGGAIGGAGDIITPLNVRDPSALVMGPGAAQQPPAGSAAPATPPVSAPSTSKEDFKDALAGAASRAASAAVKKSPVPVPKVALGGSGLRGLGAASGGSSAGASLGPVGPAAGSVGSGGGGSMNLVRSNPNFRGVAGARGPGNPTGLDGTKKAGANAGDAFSRTGSALNGLNAAASEQIPTGGTGFAGGGQGGAGANDKPGGGGQAPGSKSVGESLAFIEAKERMMENLKLEFEKRKLKDPELLMYGIRNDVLKASAGEVGKWITKQMLDGADSLLKGKDANALSLDCGGGNTGLPLKVTCDKDKTSGCVLQEGGRWYWKSALGDSKSVECNIRQGAATAKPASTTEGGAVTGTPGAGGEADRNSTGEANNLKTACSDLDSISKSDNPTDKVKDEAAAKARYKEGTEYSSIKKALVGETNDGCSSLLQKPDIGALAQMTPSVASLQKAALDANKAAIDAYKAGALADEEDKEKFGKLYKDAVDKTGKAREALDKVMGAAGLNLSNVELGSKTEWSEQTLIGNNGQNRTKLVAIQGVLDRSRTDVAQKLSALNEAQASLDGQVTPGTDTGAVVPQLGAVVGGDNKGGAQVPGSPINVTQKTNAAFKSYVGSLEGKPVDVPTEASPATVTADKEGITGNATGGKAGAASYDALKDKADTAINDSIAKKKIADAPDATPVQKTEAEDAKKAASDAVKAMKATVLGVQAAQTGWLDNIDKRLTSARSKVPGAGAAQ